MNSFIKELKLAQNGASMESQKSSDDTNNKTTQTTEEKPIKNDSKATAEKPGVEEETNGDPTGKGIQINDDMPHVAEEAPKRRIRKKRDE